MAGGNLTPRQKMINLMYLVFIAMLALNMSKEVLSAFGLMNEKFSDVNKFSKDYNQGLYDQLASKASENKAQFGVPFEQAKQIRPIVDEFFKFIEGVKSEVSGSFKPEESGVNKGKLPYEAMDKSTIDEVWFAGDGYSKRGTEIVAAFDKFKKGIADVIGKDVKYQIIMEDLNKRFSTADVTDGEGVKKKYLDYHYKGFPAIATVSKLSAVQNDAKKVEQDIYNALIGNTTAAAASMKNYKAIVNFEKNVVFQGEAVKGRVVLGRYDESTVPQSIVVNGASSKIESGQAVFTATAGGIGEKNITGKFTFIEDGKPVIIEFEDKYVVVPRPNQAIISADKMNVVYRGVENPISVSIPGISADKVTASAPGMRSTGKQGSYVITPTTGNSVKITATGKLPDGKTVSSSVDFRIKGLPSPQGRIRGEASPKGPKSSLEQSTVTAVMEDFDFPITVTVKQFNLKVPGQPTIVVSGNRMNGAALAAIKKAGRGDVVTISEIKAEFVGLPVRPKATSPCSFEIQ